MKYILIALLLFPLVSSAHGFHSYVESVITFINNVIIPFLLGLAFLFFAINAIRYFVLEGGTDDGRSKAKALALYSVMAFVVIIIFWGMLSVLVKGTGLGGHAVPASDYVERG